jgi:hypothetical protein
MAKIALYGIEDDACVFYCFAPGIIGNRAC